MVFTQMTAFIPCLMYTISSTNPQIYACSGKCVANHQMGLGIWYLWFFFWIKIKPIFYILDSSGAFSIHG